MNRSQPRPSASHARSHPGGATGLGGHQRRLGRRGLQARCRQPAGATRCQLHAPVRSSSRIGWWRCGPRVLLVTSPAALRERGRRASGSSSPAGKGRNLAGVHRGHPGSLSLVSAGWAAGSNVLAAHSTNSGGPGQAAEQAPRGGRRAASTMAVALTGANVTGGPNRDEATSPGIARILVGGGSTCRMPGGTERERSGANRAGCGGCSETVAAARTWRRPAVGVAVS